jgi:hypothetical protein
MGQIIRVVRKFCNVFSRQRSILRNQLLANFEC